MTETLEVVPRQWKVVQHVREKLSCRSCEAITHRMRTLGAKDGMLLDGGGSSSIAIGQGAQGVAPGVLFGGWRAVATHIGIKAKSLP